jgi:hypothetical protein
VQAGPEPGDHVAQVGVPLDLLHRDRAAVGHETGVDRLVVGEQLPDPGVQPVRADGDPGSELAAVGAGRRHAAAGVRQCGHVRVGVQFHAAALAPLEQRAEQVVAVQHQVGRAVPGREVGELERSELPPRDRVGQHQAPRQHGDRLDLLEHAEAAQDAGRVRGELDARAHLGEALRALDQGDGAAPEREAQRGREPPDAAADDQRLGKYV